MSSCDYYGIQFMQSRYLLMWESAMFDSIVEEVFCAGESISVNYEGFHPIARGREAVSRFFGDIKILAAENGSILRNDLPTSQYIRVCEENTVMASGEWITMSAVIEGPAYGNTEPPWPYSYQIGIYHNTFIKENGEWRLQNLDWRPLISVGEDWKMNPKTCVGLYYSNPEKWPKPFEKHSFDFEPPGLRDEANIQVRSMLFHFAHEFTYHGKSAVRDDIFQKDAQEGVLAMLPDERNGFNGTLLLTSPIVQISEDLEQASMFMNTGVISPNGDTVIHRKGRICTTLKRYNSRWKFDTFQWYCYASLEPWKLTGFYPELFSEFEGGGKWNYPG